MARGTTQAVVILSAVDKASRVINGALQGVDRRLQKFQRSAQAFGQQAFMGAAAIGAPLVLATKRATEFETRMADVSTLIGDVTDEQMKRMGDQVLTMGNLGKPLQELESGLYDIVSAGVQASDQMNELEQSTRLAIGGRGTTEGAVDIMTSSYNAFSQEALTAAERANLVFKAVKYGKTDVTKLSEGFGANAAVLADNNVLLRDYLAGTAALTTSGVRAAQAQNQLRAAVTSMQKPTAEMATIMRALGAESGKDLITRYGTLGKTFDAIKGKAGDLNINLAKAYGRTEALAAATSLTGATAGIYTNALDDMASGTDALGGAYDKQSKTGAAAMARLKNSLDTLAITAGQVLIPVLEKLIDTVGPIITDMADWVDRNEELAENIGLAAAAVAAFLAVAGTIGFALSAAVAPIRGMIALQWAWNVALNANPIGLIVLAIFALIAAIVAVTVYFDDIRAWFEDQNTVVQVLIGSLMLVVAPIIAIVYAINYLVAEWDNIIASIETGINDAINWFMGIHTAVVDTFQSIFDYIASIPAKMYEAGVNIATSIADGIKSAVMYPINAVSDMVQGVRDFLPFSPAKVGPLKDIHRLKLVETIADNIQPGPAVRAMQNVAGGIAAVAPPAAAGQAQPLTRPTAAASSAETFAPQITINVNAGNGGQSTAEIGREVARQTATTIEELYRKFLALSARETERGIG